MSDCCLPVYWLYNDENKLLSDKIMIMSALYWTNKLCCIFIGLRSLKQHSKGTWRHVDPSGHIIRLPSQSDFAYILNVACRAEKRQIPIKKIWNVVGSSVSRARGNDSNAGTSQNWITMSHTYIQTNIQLSDKYEKGVFTNDK